MKLLTESNADIFVDKLFPGVSVRLAISNGRGSAAATIYVNLTNTEARDLAVALQREAERSK